MVKSAPKVNYLLHSLHKVYARHQPFCLPRMYLVYVTKPSPMDTRTAGAVWITTIFSRISKKMLYPFKLGFSMHGVEWACCRAFDHNEYIQEHRRLHQGRSQSELQLITSAQARRHNGTSFTRKCRD